MGCTVRWLSSTALSSGGHEPPRDALVRPETPMPLNLDLSVLASFTLLSLAVVPCLCSYTPIGPNLSAVFFWRCRRVQGWAAQRVAFFVPQPPGSPSLGGAGAGSCDAGEHGARRQPARAPVRARRGSVTPAQDHAEHGAAAAGVGGGFRLGRRFEQPDGRCCH